MGLKFSSSKDKPKETRQSLKAFEPGKAIQYVVKKRQLEQLSFFNLT